MVNATEVVVGKILNLGCGVEWTRIGKCLKFGSGVVGDTGLEGIRRDDLGRANRGGCCVAEI